MTKKISDSWEWNLTAAQKNLVCWGFGALGLVAMVFYSFPNTVLFFVQAISLPLAHEYISRAVAVSLAVFNNGLELAALYLLIWKIKHITSAILAGAIMAVTGFFSVVGTFGSLETSDQQLAAERKKSQYLAAETVNIQSSIDQKSQLLAANNQQISDLQFQGKNASTYLYNRSLDLSGEIDRLTVQLRERGTAAAEQAILAPKSVLKPDQKRTFNLWFSPVIEALMLLCTAISVLVYKEIKEDAGETVTGAGFDVRSGGGNEAIPATAKKTGPGAMGFAVENIPKTFQKNIPGTFQEREKIVSEIIPENEFLHGLRERKKPLTLTAENVPEIVPGNGVSIGDLRTIFQTEFRGKSDPFILYVFDNWETISDQRFSYGNLTKLVCNVLPGKQTVSKTYAYRVIQENRSQAEGGAK